MKHQMIVLSHDGDFRIEWDAEDEIETEKARAHFEDLRGKRYTAFSAQRKSRLDSFQSEEEEIIMVPRLMGG